ncbi:MAG: hypothetical protein IKF72_08105 [Kiritimatiellae bacterium]|nr:hypothetical protein [Kiritimatiellia bacterium]
MNEQGNDNACGQAAASATGRQAGQYRPQLAIYHPNGKGTGGAAKIDLHPAHDASAGCLMLKLASQCAVGGQSGGVAQFARFDWENAISVKLDFNDICAILQVFGGECESLCDGHGLYHRTARASTKIAMRHIIDPHPGYSLDLYRTSSDGSECRAHLMLSQAEAAGLRAAIMGSMSTICFGIPMLIEHDTSAYQALSRSWRAARHNGIPAERQPKPSVTPRRQRLCHPTCPADNIG